MKRAVHRRVGCLLAFRNFGVSPIRFASCPHRTAPPARGFSSHETKLSKPQTQLSRPETQLSKDEGEKKEVTYDIPNAEKLLGNWKGKLGPDQSRLLFTVTRAKEDGKLSVVMDVPSEELFGHPKDSPGNVSYENGECIFQIDQNMRFEFAWPLESSKLRGLLLDGENDFSLTIKRMMAKTKKSSAQEADRVPERKQTPKPPFPYIVEPVTLELAPEGFREVKVVLSGSLTLPRGDPPAGGFPAVLLVTGAGPHDRDETVFGHKPFMVIADNLTREGFAVLRVDDRGVSSSKVLVKEKAFMHTSWRQQVWPTPILAQDTVECLRWMQERTDINASKIALVGHGEGGLTAAMAIQMAHEQGLQDVGAVVALSTHCTTGKELMIEQHAAVHRSNGVDDAAIATGTALFDGIYKAVIKHDDKFPLSAVTGESLLSLHEDPVCIDYAAGLAAAIRKEIEVMTDAHRVALFSDFQGDHFGHMAAALSSPWSRYFLAHDAAHSWRAVKRLRTPVLALAGSNDVQVPARHLRLLSKILGTKAFTQEIPGLNHLFHKSRTGSPREYKKASKETVAVPVLNTISSWLHTTFKSW